MIDDRHEARRLGVLKALRERMASLGPAEMLIRTVGVIDPKAVRSWVEGGEIPPTKIGALVRAAWPGMQLDGAWRIIPIPPVPTATEETAPGMRPFAYPHPVDRWEGLHVRAARLDGVGAVLVRRDPAGGRAAGMFSLAAECRRAANTWDHEAASAADRQFAALVDFDETEHRLAVEEAARLRVPPPTSWKSYGRIFGKSKGE